ncbi:hypothetical protein IAI10_16975 [Clostridium sp. 19966]|uniref:hypothetical protein n=1 Tax=Clostridium sp. 19966 TaxID=2768166 RepID=UPI0028DEF380|nr:hypothetical protein [Clostridium sp. 19966]MDT8718362.1 hypothetical protein [Clostridium sp. 19966]
MTTKLIIVEGLPGSGKSTTAEALYNILKNRGINAELYSEGNVDHPADFDGAAYFTKEEFIELKHFYSKSDKLLEEIKIEYEEGYIIQYRKLIEQQKICFVEELYKEIIKHDIYELPLEMHKSLILSRWKEFVREYANKDKVVIFECCFIQNPVTVSMIRNNADKEFTKNYIMELADIILPLEPVLIYVNQRNIKTAFINAVNTRPKEWFQGFTGYYTKQGYGLANNLSGLEGVIKVLEARRKLEEGIYEAIKLNKYRIDNSEFDVNLLENKIVIIVERLY